MDILYDLFFYKEKFWCPYPKYARASDVTVYMLEILVLSQLEVDLVLHDTHRVAGKCVWPRYIQHHVWYL